MSTAYNCKRCPGFCCSYPVIEVTQRDIRRLAKHFGIEPEQAEKRFTRSGDDSKRILRRKQDEHFGRICRLFDTVTRRCTVYEARPGVCREYPTMYRCGYYEFLKFERYQQEDRDWVATTSNGEWP